jgi:hypothetical protein
MPTIREHARLTALLVMAIAAPEAFSQTSPWYIGASQAFAYDSNLYRIDDNVTLGEGFSRSDTISTTSLIGGIDQPIGRQRVFGSMSIGYNRYANNDYLNNTSYRFTGGLDWSTVERYSGNLSFASSEAQREFNIDTAPGAAPETEQNLERVNQIDAIFRAGTVTRLTLEGRLGFRQVDYTAADFASLEYERTSGSLGVRYRPGIATFGAAISLADTDYNTSAERERRTALDLTGSWPANGISSLFVRLSPTRVEYDQFSERDFTGLTGSLRWLWQPTGKLDFTTTLVHDIGQDSDFESFGGPVVIGTSNTGRTTTDLRFAAGYALSAKVSMSAALSTSHRDLEETTNVSGEAIVTGTGSDDTVVFSLGARWTPLRSVQVGCDVGREQRSAKGGLTTDYSTNLVSCFGQFTLQ